MTTLLEPPVTIADPAAPELRLARQAREGDAAAFAALMRRHNQRLFRLARSLVGEDEAEDAVQEAWIQAYLHLDGFRGEASLSTWLSRIVINQALERRRRRRPTVDLDSIDDVLLEDSPMTAPSAAQLPEQQAARSEVRRLMERAIDALPPAFRTVFVMRAVEEMSVEETSVVLDIPAATVKTRFHRARRLLRSSLAEQLAPTVAEVFPFLGSRCDRIASRVLDRLGLAPGGGPAAPPNGPSGPP